MKPCEVRPRGLIAGFLVVGVRSGGEDGVRGVSAGTVSGLDRRGAGRRRGRCARGLRGCRRGRRPRRLNRAPEVPFEVPTRADLSSFRRTSNGLLAAETPLQHISGGIQISAPQLHKTPANARVVSFWEATKDPSPASGMQETGRWRPRAGPRCSSAGDVAIAARLARLTSGKQTLRAQRLALIRATEGGGHSAASSDGSAS